MILAIVEEEVEAVGGGVDRDQEADPEDGQGLSFNLNNFNTVICALMRSVDICEYFFSFQALK